MAAEERTGDHDGTRSDSILAELGTLLRRTCQYGEFELSVETWIADIPGIDSLRTLQAVAHLEEHFGVEVDLEALNNLLRVQDIVGAISQGRPMNA
jgi:hypothetical protein